MANIARFTIIRNHVPKREKIDINRPDKIQEGYNTTKTTTTMR